MNRSLPLLLTAFGIFFATQLSASGQTDRLTDQLLKESMEQLVSDAEKFGNPTRGAAAFYQATLNCARCHQENENGRQLGPDLAERREVDWKHLAESVLKPSANIKKEYRTLQVLLDDGRVVSGILRNETDQFLEIDQIQFAESMKIDKDTVDDQQWSEQSTMPEGLANQLNDRQQFLDLVSYLAAIAEGGPVVEDQLRPEVATLAPLPEYENRVDHAGLIQSLDANAMASGAEIYRLRCASCHGTVDQEGSMPTSLRFSSGKFKHGSDPLTMYRTLTHGYGMMIPQRWMVPRQKYEVIHYIREHFLRSHNSGELFKVTPEYLAQLPKGDTWGPEPVVSRPWTQMDYGPSLNNTIEISRDGSNIAQKGIVIRLDDGPGGVESGKYWMLYEHDTLRMAAAWQGSFIDYEGIHFNGAHAIHPKVTGEVVFRNPTAPGFADPAKSNDSFVDRFKERRVQGRDGKYYGPMPKTWGRFDGLYRFGRQSVLKYHVGETEVLESPGLKFSQRTPVFLRRFEFGESKQNLVIQVVKQRFGQSKIDGATLTLLPDGADSKVGGLADSKTSNKRKQIDFDRQQFYQVDAKPFHLGEKEFSILARIKTRSDGTIFCKTRNQQKWLPKGRSLFVRNGRPTFDIGWVGAVSANRKVNDGKWHKIAMTWSDGNVSFYIDGKAAGGGKLEVEEDLTDGVVRIGRTNEDFPAKSQFQGSIDQIRFYQRKLSQQEIQNWSKISDNGLIAIWNHQEDKRLTRFDQRQDSALDATTEAKSKQETGLYLTLVGDSKTKKACKWHLSEDGNVRLEVPVGTRLLGIACAQISSSNETTALNEITQKMKVRPLKPMTEGGAPNYPEVLTTEVIPGDESQPFAVDVFKRPEVNPWNCRMRLTGVDFMSDSNVAMVTAWDGSVWKVSGLGATDQVVNSPSLRGQSVTWKRFAYGLFQPLGVKVIDDIPFVICRDQLVALHDLNGDGEADWYENVNSDHQVTEHFHEFAAGLQTDDLGNFYYAKCARHAKPAIVPQHGTLLKISRDGSRTEILANGFRAPNGVCLNGDGSFFLTDQEGHWTPKNRINHVQVGKFYGNMMGYHDGVDDDDQAMEEPVCWITNAFDRSPSELLWVESDRWGPLKGKLLNLSYGYGQVYIVNYEKVDGKMQGGMTKLPIPQFPTGIMRGRFHPIDQQLYCCGMFAWAGNQQQPGGFYRIRYTGKPLHTPSKVEVTDSGLVLTLTDAVSPAVAADPKNYRVEVWDLVRASRYGSKHHEQRTLEIKNAKITNDNKSIELVIPDLKPTRGMKLLWSLKTSDGKRIQGEYHGSIFNQK